MLDKLFKSQYLFAVLCQEFTLVMYSLRVVQTFARYANSRDFLTCSKQIK